MPKEKQSKQHKAKFIADYYVEIQGICDLNLVTAYLNCRSLMYVVEPWPDEWYRVYARKDVRGELEASMGIFGGKYIWRAKGEDWGEGKGGKF